MNGSRAAVAARARATDWRLPLMATSVGWMVTSRSGPRSTSSRSGTSERTDAPPTRPSSFDGVSRSHKGHRQQAANEATDQREDGGDDRHQPDIQQPPCRARPLELSGGKLARRDVGTMQAALQLAAGHPAVGLRARRGQVSTEAHEGSHPAT